MGYRSPYYCLQATGRLLTLKKCFLIVEQKMVGFRIIADHDYPSIAQNSKSCDIKSFERSRKLLI
jgi:hypothetical protein